MLEWMWRELGLAERPAELAAVARDTTTAQVRASRDPAGLGAPWWKPEAHPAVAAKQETVEDGARESTSAGGRLWPLPWCCARN